MKLKKCKCGGEPKVFAHYSCVYERIHGYAECPQCGKQVWGKVTFNTYGVDTRAHNFRKWKRKAYGKVRRSIAEEWNREVV